MERRHWLWAGAVAGVAIAIAAGWGMLRAVPSLAGHANELDMVGMLEDLHTTNSAIGEVNQEIGDSLTAVRTQAEKINRVHASLQRLEGGLKDQQAVLDNLGLVTGKQAELSRALQDLTASITPSTAGIAGTAAAEADAVERMSAVTGHLAQQMGEIDRLNRSTNAKMGRAEQLSALILTRLP